MGFNIEGFGERFQVLREVGRGAAGVVHEAIDLHTSQRVALKVLDGDPSAIPEEAARIEHEGAVLQRLAHPNIVRVHTYGRTVSGQPYVALEWLEGETLEARHRREPLDAVQALAVTKQIAQCLVEVHRQGIVHRDIKPENIFLAVTPQGVELCKLIDFGIASVTGGPSIVHEPLGTPAYMAPEQVRSDAVVDHRADLYGLGATLFELLTGRSPHEASSTTATLARLVTTAAPSLRSLRWDLPAALDRLLGDLLATDARHRPTDAQEVVQRLTELEEILATYVPDSVVSHPAGVPISSRLGSSVVRLISAIVALNLTSASNRERVLDQLRQRGALTIPFGTDAVVALFGLERAVGREAVEALSMGRRIAGSGAQVGVATGRVIMASASSSGDGLPAGDVVDRAAALARGAASGEVVADATTGELGRGRFHFRVHPNGSVVVGEPLRGQRTEVLGGVPFVGRELELAQVLGAFEQVVKTGQAMLVTIAGPPGMGKTRLQREVLGRISDRTGHVVLQRSDAYAHGHTLGAAADILRSLTGLSKGATADEADVALGQLFDAAGPGRFPAEQRRSLARLLSASGADDELRLGGQRDTLWLAMTQLFSTVAGAGPTVIVMEDLQWCDTESLDWIDHLLERLQQPVLILAMPRPEFWQEHTKQFQGRPHLRLDLHPISVAASRSIAESLLVDRATEETVSAIAAQAGGLPLFAEELARLAGKGASLAHAPTIEAAIQASIDALDPECRDALGRLSVLGVTCWDAALEALGMTDGEGLMRALAGAEHLVEQSRSPFVGTREWIFKHAFVRDVAYRSLGDRERQELHILAARWLDSMGEAPARVAQHYDLGADPISASHHWERAARQALAANSLAEAVTSAERALAFAEERPTAFRRASLLDEAWSRLDPRASDRESAVSAMEGNATDEMSTMRARGARARYLDAKGIGNVIEELRAVRIEAAELHCRDEEARCCAALATRLAYAGRFNEAEAEAARLLAFSAEPGLEASAVDTWQTIAIIRQAQGAVGSALEARRAAVRAARQAGLREREAVLMTNLGFALSTVGARHESRAALEDGLTVAQAIGSDGAVRHARMNLLGWAATFGSDASLEKLLAADREAAEAAAQNIWASRDRSNLGAIFYRGWELLRNGSAPHRARDMLQVSTEIYRAHGHRDLLPVALGVLGAAELACNNTTRALAHSSEAFELLTAGAPSLLNEAVIYTTLARSLRAMHRHAESEEAIARGMEPLLRRLEGILGTPYAHAFLTELPDNAELLELAQPLGVLPPEIRRLVQESTDSEPPWMREMPTR